MSERLPDDQAEIERVFLWQDIVETFRANTDTFGVQLLFETPDGPFYGYTRLVLEEAASEDEDTCIQLWAIVNEKALIGQAQLLYINDAGKEEFSYTLTPSGIHQYSPDPTSLNREDLQDIRTELAEVQWSKVASQNRASELMFLDS